MRQHKQVPSFQSDRERAGRLRLANIECMPRPRHAHVEQPHHGVAWRSYLLVLRVTRPREVRKQIHHVGLAALDAVDRSDLITTYTYDALAHLTQVTMTRQGTTQTRTFTYDSTTQRLTSVQTPEAGITTYAYNSDGTLQSKTDAKGQQTKYQYDAWQRVLETDYVPTGSGQPDPCQTVQYQYDSATVLQPGGERNGYGRLTGLYWSSPNCQYQFAEEYAYGYTHLVTQKQLTVRNTTSNVPDVVMNGYFSYDAESRLYYFETPYDAARPGTQTYTWDRDALARPIDMYSGSTQSPTSLVGGVTYNGSGRMLTMSTFYSETRQYNANGQLTRQTAGGAQGLDLSYNYPSSNNGRVASITDNLTGQQVSYTYDPLNRLTQATTSDAAWGLSFSYDGFGNLTQQTRIQGSTAPQMSVSVDPATNRINSAGYSYDANGNVTRTPDGSTYSYDVANRMVSNGSMTYDPYNRRIYDGTYLYYYNVDGTLMGRYLAAWANTVTVGGVAYTSVILQGGPNLYFNRRPIQLGGHGGYVITDRLGSVRVNGNRERFNYYPYGTEIGTESTEHRVKFGTYFRDSAGVGYANQRYYGVGSGRFNTPDPYSAGGGPSDRSDPGSWNLYAYAQGDPINFNDPHGLFQNAARDGDGDGESTFDFDICTFYPRYPGCGKGPTAPKPKPPSGWNTHPAGTGRTAWQYLTSVWSNCLSDYEQLAGFDASAFQKLLSDDMRFLDTRSSGIAARTVDSYTHDGDSTRLGDLFSTGEGNVAVALVGSHFVALGPDYFADQTQTEQIAIAIHEALHMTFQAPSGQDPDAYLGGLLSQFGFSATKDSQSITDWIVGSKDHMSTTSGGCTNPPK